MLNEDQFLRLSLLDSANHKIFLNKKKNNEEEKNVKSELIKKKLKTFQGEMQMYSGMWGMIYNHVIWKKRWVKRITKNLEKVQVNSTIPKDKLYEAYTFFVPEPKLLQFHVSLLYPLLDTTKEVFQIKEIIEAMKKLDMDHYKAKIKESFKYFDNDGTGIDTET